MYKDYGTANDKLCKLFNIEEQYSSKLLQEKLHQINKGPIVITREILNMFIIEVHSRIITIQRDLEIRSSKITIKIMREEIELLKVLENNISDMYPEYSL